MFNRKIIFSLIIFTIFIIFSLVLFVPNSKGIGEDCCSNDECPDYVPGGGWTCSNGSNYCNGNKVENMRVCWRETCDGAICPSNPGVCQRHDTTTRVDHSDDCSTYYACGGYCSSGSCVSNPVCSNPSGCEGNTRYDCSPNDADSCAINACVGLPQQCQSGTWVTTNPSGECTTDCTNCSHAAPTPTPTPGGPTPTPGPTSTPGPTPTPTPTSAPGCTSDVTMSVSPDPAAQGGNITFTVTGNAQASQCIGDIWTAGSVATIPGGRDCSCTTVNAAGNNCGTWGTRNCTAASPRPSTYTWTHYWRTTGAASCTAGTQCSKSWPFSITAPITPWIQVTGDVHSNVRIYAPGGP